MKEEEIRKIVEGRQLIFTRHSTIYGKIKMGVGAYNNGIKEMMHTMTCHILHINAEGIVIIALDDLTGNPLEQALVFIPRESILSTDIRCKFFSFLLIIKTEKGSIVYRLHKNVFASPWHKENLSFLFLNSFGEINGEKCKIK